MDAAAVAAQIRAQKVVPIVRAPDEETGLARAASVLEAGLGIVEVSLVTPGALRVVEQLRAQFPEAAVGAGTVLDGAAARDAAAAGALFLVSPIFSREMVAAAREDGLVTLPGCLTPTEMVEALAAGADFVKIFPASAWSPRDLRGVLEALPHIPAVPTGGVSAQTAPEWVDAGAVAVGMGSWLTAAEPEVIRERVEKLRTALA